jgi:hypothetical protein
VFALATSCAYRRDETNARNEALSLQHRMTIETNRTKDEAAIRELIDGFVKAIRAKDINGVMSVFAPEVVSFDLGPPLQHGGGSCDTFFRRRMWLGATLHAKRAMANAKSGPALDRLEELLAKI